MRRMLAIAGAIALLGGTANAGIITYNFPLDGLQEVPPVATPGSGTGLVQINTNTNLLSWNIAYSGLIGSPTASHFHGPAAPGSNAGVQVNIGVLSGGLTSPMIGSTVISASQEADLLAGLWYVNVHSTYRPGGEIRGQVVPEPSTLALVGIGVVALFRRRR